MTHPSTTPELLAPAGTIEAGLTALDAGADAVYAGLAKFNARERGKNFDLEALSKLIGGHIRPRPALALAIHGDTGGTEHGYHAGNTEPLRPSHDHVR